MIGVGVGFATKTKIVKWAQKLPLGSLNSSVIGKSSPKFAMQSTQRLMVLYEK